MDTHTALHAFAALSQQRRLDAIRLLLRHEPTGLPAGEIARQLNVPQDSMSVHLGVLSRAGLVRSTHKGRWTFFRADLDALDSLSTFLTEECRAAREGTSA